MGIGGDAVYRDGTNLSPHLSYFEERCMAKGATMEKAHQWAWRMVTKGKRMPGEVSRG